MSLASYTYLLAFLPLAVIAYYRSPHSYQNRVLLGISLLFYCWVDPRFGLFLIYIILVTFLAARWIHRARDRGDPRRARWILGLAVTLCLLAMGLPKYGDFCLDQARWLAGLPARADSMAGPSDGPLFGWLLPFGISFYTFQALSYLIDVSRGRAPEPSLERYALFVAFFPQLVAGPIMRADQLLGQFIPRDRPQWSDLHTGAYLILKGLFYKIALGDPCGELVREARIADNDITAYRVILFCLAFSWQVFFDFHGYTTIARGSARLFGIDLARNFYFPFYAHSFADHWRRWHVTLSSWLKEYLYISLGGNRRGRLRTSMNLMITMALGGLWHGAGWNYVLWGMLHGLYLIVERGIGMKDWKPTGVARFGAACVVYFFCVPAFGIFAMVEVRDPWPVLRSFAELDGAGTGLMLAGVLVTVSLSRIALSFEERDLGRHALVRLTLATLMLGGLLLSGGEARDFIYYQF